MAARVNAFYVRYQVQPLRPDWIELIGRARAGWERRSNNPAATHVFIADELLPPEGFAADSGLLVQRVPAAPAFCLGVGVLDPEA